MYIYIYIYFHILYIRTRSINCTCTYTYNTRDYFAIKRSKLFFLNDSAVHLLRRTEIFFFLFFFLLLLFFLFFLQLLSFFYSFIIFLLSLFSRTRFHFVLFALLVAPSDVKSVTLRPVITAQYSTFDISISYLSISTLYTRD